ncbi:chromosome segregation protein, Smc [Halomicronema hongdechloris C2206]|uniref:Chromosome segregation protein, Smc n=1 Tax=Halomicronema hongdechloris C2206 TaxID=1641165 RepID=A0A1Z3HRT4_9CYAN|nr:hypothetical protein [Halomicronema hongdechloris]ASC72966.1 chromosome segregation protein, Smc [Halomicronema hongdechloris C2206]
MQYLAKVQQRAFLASTELVLLAQQTGEYTWERLTSERIVEAADLVGFEAGHLVLVELNPLHQVTAVEDATPWVLALVDQFLAHGVTPDFLATEVERAERWRQSLTLKSQEVDRRALETAARRDEIQALEQNLKQEREALEAQRAELEAREAKLQQEFALLQQETGETD